LLAFLLISGLQGHAPQPSPLPLQSDPLQTHPGPRTPEDYFLSVEWEDRKGKFPFRHPDRLASVAELKALTARRQALLDAGVLSDEDEAADDRFIYASLFTANRTRADHMVKQFRALALRDHLDGYALAWEVVRCIQRIPYAIPDEITTDHDLGVFTPNEVAFYGKGDCDTKALMAAVVLSRLGFRCVIFGSNYYRHCMLGIETRGAGGDFTDVAGHRFQWVEMTAYGSPIGVRPEDCRDEAKWVATLLPE
jgi:hypothetical protein